MIMVMAVLWLSACSQNKPEPQVETKAKTNKVEVEIKTPKVQTKVEEVVKREVQPKVQIDKIVEPPKVQEVVTYAPQEENIEAVEVQRIEEEEEEFIPEHLKHSKIEVVKHY